MCLEDSHLRFAFSASIVLGNIRQMGIPNNQFQVSSLSSVHSRNQSHHHCWDQKVLH